MVSLVVRCMVERVLPREGGVVNTACVVGAGPNGLSAAIALRQSGWSVTVVERAETVGGAARSEAVTLPGFIHDIGAGVHPFGAASPFFRSIACCSIGSCIVAGTSHWQAAAGTRSSISCDAATNPMLALRVATN